MSARRLWILFTSLLVIVATGAPFLLGKQELRDPPAAPRGLQETFHYYVMIPLIEVTPRTPDDDAYDSGGSAPDLYYQVRWQEQTVFESSTKKNTLLAKWSNSELGLTEIVQGISFDGSIKAARITARAGDELEFRIYDDDAMSDDLIATIRMPVASLGQGDQVFPAPAPGIVTMTVRVLPFDGTPPEVLVK